MDPPLLPTTHSQPTHGRTLRHWRADIHSSPFRSVFFFGVIIFSSSLILYTTLLSPHGTLWLRPPNWPAIFQHEPPVPDLEHTSLSTSSSEATTTSAETSYPSPSPTPIPNVLTVEQIRDIVAPTKGFLTRDYSLGLGWNNVSVRHVS